MIRVVIAEDSATTRELLIGILDSDPDVQVVGAAKDGLEAVDMTRRLRPDVVTMDIQMPGLSGFEATKKIMVESPTPIVIVSASVDVRQVEISMHALRAGAVALLPKPPSPNHHDFDAVRREFLATVKSMSQVKVVRHWSRPARIPVPPQRPRRGSARVVAIAASTGGPAALQRVLIDLPGDLPVPLLVVQHLATGFVAGMASWLNASSSLNVKVAEQGEALVGGNVYIAPDGRHLGVDAAGRVFLSAAPPVNGFRPSASALFEAVARQFGASSVAVILTGMGDDGVSGLRAVHAAGGTVVAQDESTSTVFGMPAAAIASGLAHAVLPLSSIAAHIQQICQREDSRA